MPDNNKDNNKDNEDEKDRAFAQVVKKVIEDKFPDLSVEFANETGGCLVIDSEDEFDAAALLKQLLEEACGGER